MRYATTPRSSYIVLIVLGIGFVGGAVPFWRSVPPPAGHLVAVIWAIVGAGMLFFSLTALRRRGDDDRIASSGTPASATLLSATTTGWVVNGVPQWALRLRIDGNGAPYETTMKLQTYNPPSNGSVVAVRCDPLRRTRVVIAADDAVPPSRPQPATAAAPVVEGAALTPELQRSVLDALEAAGLGQPGTTSVVNADGSRTITSIGYGGSTSGAGDPAETVRLLSELDRMHASGALGDHEFETIKRRLLGEA